MPQLREILPNLWSCELASPDIQARALVLIGEKHAVVWDTLTHPADVAPLAELIGESPFYVIYSHGDWDHVWGTAGFANEPLDIIAHAECLRRFADDAPRAPRRMQLAELGKWASVRLVPPTITFTSYLSLDLGGFTLELHHLPGHTEDSIVGWIPEWGVFLGGDAIETPLPVVNNAHLLRAWLTALEAWQNAESLARSIPSHGSLEGRDSLDKTVAYLRALSGDRKFKLPRKLDEFYRETHRKNLIVVDGGLNPHE